MLLIAGELIADAEELFDGIADGVETTVSYGVHYTILVAAGQCDRSHDADAMMLVGGGQKGIEPLVMANGGTPYRAFLEGRVDGDKYALILRLTNMELKSIEQ